ncbi:hypothetical protein EGW08_018156 [Elysia chlorotica]|uniref:Sema domain-containing protein n=1 Tax=Elysia chlorotica TaxID=188477 RepID=A0A3S1BSV0_ELYCH|nr:hypothetical protein EGW08_018156 [Elysia chlorotica]
MDYTPNGITMLFAVMVATHLTCLVSGWSQEWSPNYVSTDPEMKFTLEKVTSSFPGADYFQLLLAEEDRIFIGAKNRVYNIRVNDLKLASILEWNANEVSIDKCRMNSKTDCANYVRVIVRKEGDLVICGTNAYSPVCRHYKLTEKDEFEKQREDSPGTAICPFDAQSNATALYTGGKLYTATRAHSDGAGPLILKSSEDRKLRTTFGDSTLLNEPNFVSSFEKDDKVYFFFREIAVENINCGKAVFSRVARVCKQDSGGYFESWKNTLTSFFKARLNCSIPGEFPFYFDEIQSTSEFGQGNIKRTRLSGDRYDLIYGVFNTPENSIRGSAVCAFRYSDITNVFKGQFKGQKTYESFWLPVPWSQTPIDHPEKCTNESDKIPDDTAKFSKDHPLMDEAVKPTGGMPVLIFTSLKAKLTKIAIDWQLLAADKRYYDVMFVGTDDGRVIKAINKGDGAKVESVIIEDLQVLSPGKPVVGLKVISNRADHANQKLVVVSKDSVVAIPLSRCERAETCKSCVALQDPYCAWSSLLKQCINAGNGLQNISSGKHRQCPADPIDAKKLQMKKPSEDSLVVDAQSSCSCPDLDEQPGPSDVWKRINPHASADVKVAASQEETAVTRGTPVEVFIVAVIGSIIFSVVLGFIIGYKFQSCRRDRDDVFYDRNCSSLQRGRNRLSSGDNPHFHTDHVGLAPKQINIVMNRKGNLVETKPVTKSNKVYL